METVVVSVRGTRNKLFRLWNILFRIVIRQVTCGNTSNLHENVRAEGFLRFFLFKKEMS